MRAFFIIILAVLILAGCTKDNKCKQEICLDAYVFWGGEPALDGIGWYVAASRSSDKIYMVEGLKPAFMTDSIPVKTCLRQSTKHAVCNCMEPPYVYDIVNMQVR